MKMEQLMVAIFGTVLHLQASFRIFNDKFVLRKQKKLIFFYYHK